MESSKALCLIVFVVALLGTSSAGGRGEGFNDLANQGDINNKYKACCDSGICALSYPPQCRCYDVGTTCHAACKDCVCTKSNPPQCRCTDTTPYSYGPCTCEAANNI